MLDPQPQPQVQSSTGENLPTAICVISRPNTRLLEVPAPEVVMRPTLCLACILFLISIAAARAEDAAVSKRFHDLLADEWEYRLKESPTFASHLGDKRYNDCWPDVSLSATARRHQHLKEVLAKLEQIDRQQLSPADRLNHQLYRLDLAEDIELYPFRWYLVPLNQRGGIQTEHELAD